MKVNIALLTVTDTRTIDNDKSGGILVNRIKEANHNLIDRKICKDNKDDIVIILKEWLKNEKTCCIFRASSLCFGNQDIIYKMGRVGLQSVLYSTLLLGFAGSST